MTTARDLRDALLEALEPWTDMPLPAISKDIDAIIAAARAEAATPSGAELLRRADEAERLRAALLELRAAANVRYLTGRIPRGALDKTLRRADAALATPATDDADPLDNPEVRRLRREFQDFVVAATDDARCWQRADCLLAYGHDGPCATPATDDGEPDPTALLG